MANGTTGLKIGTKRPRPQMKSCPQEECKGATASLTKWQAQARGPGNKGIPNKGKAKCGHVNGNEFKKWIVPELN